jgi:hypothetical protein
MRSCDFGEPLFSLKDFTVNFYRGRKLELGNFENYRYNKENGRKVIFLKVLHHLYNSWSFIISVIIVIQTMF